MVETDLLKNEYDEAMLKQQLLDLVVKANQHRKSYLNYFTLASTSFEKAISTYYSIEAEKERTEFILLDKKIELITKQLELLEDFE